MLGYPVNGKVPKNKKKVNRDQRLVTLTFDFCLSTSIPVLTTSSYVVAWPQGDQLDFARKKNYKYTNQ